MNILTKENLLTGETAIKAHMAAVKKSGKALDYAIQIMLASAANHAQLHGDITLVNFAMESMNKGARLNAAREFLFQFAPVNWNQKKEVFVHAKTKVVEGWEGSELYQKMLATDWTTLKPDAPFRGFDLQAKIASLIKSATEQVETKGALTAEQLEKVKVEADEVALLAQFEKDLAALRAKKIKVKEDAIKAEILAAPAPVVEAAPVADDAAKMAELLALGKELAGDEPAIAEAIEQFESGLTTQEQMDSKILEIMLKMEADNA